MEGSVGCSGEGDMVLGPQRTELLALRLSSKCAFPRRWIPSLWSAPLWRLQLPFPRKAGPCWDTLLEAPRHLLPAIQALPPPATIFLSGSRSALLNCWLLSEHALHSSPLSRPCLVHQSWLKGLPFISIEAWRNLPSFQRLV